MIEVIAALLGVMVGSIISYLVTERQNKINRKIAQADFLLRFDEMLRVYHDVHIALRNGSWATKIPGEKLPDVEGYLGLFERLNVMLKDNMIDVKLAQNFYEYRLSNIVHNAPIRRLKLRNKEENWENFSQLCTKLNVKIPEN